MALINLINSTFLSLKIIVDTLIDVGNCQTSNIKINTTFFSNANVPVRFRAQQREKYSSLQLTANCIAADLRITDHRGHKFPPSLAFFSVQNLNRMASGFTAIASFPSVFFQLLQYSRKLPSSSAHWAALMTKTD